MVVSELGVIVNLGGRALCQVAGTAGEKLPARETP
jgi:hypothetical protein